MDNRSIEIIINAKDMASATLGRISGEMKSFGSSASQHLGSAVKAASAVAVAGLVGVGAAAYSSVKAFQESENAISQMNAVLKSTKGAAGVTSEAAQDLAGALQKVTKFGDEAIMGGQNMLLTFTNIGKDVFPQATETMLDMSQALGQDLKASSVQLGKALQDPIKGVTALSRVGVNFTDKQKEMIATMVEAGDVAGAQKLILNELNTEFGGSARAAGETLSGKIEILKNQFGELQEKVGGFIASALVPLTSKALEFVQNVDMASVLNKIVTKFQELKSAVEPVASVIAKFVSDNKEVFIEIGKKMGVIAPILIGIGIAFAVLSSPIVAFIAIVAGIAVAWKLIEMAIEAWKNNPAVRIVAGVILAVLMPVIIAVGLGYARVAVQAVTSAAKQAASWVMVQLKAYAASVSMIASAIRTGAVWVAQAIAAGVAWLAQFALMIGRAILAGLAMAAPVVMAGLAMIASAVAVGIAWLLAFWPVIAIVAVVAGLAFLLIKNWDSVVTFFKAVWSGIVAGAQWLFNAILFAVQFYINIYITIFKLLWTAVQAVWNGILFAARFVFEAIRAAIQFYISVVVNIFMWLRNTAIGVWNTIRDFAVGAFNGIVNFIGGAIGRIVSFGQSMGNGIKNGISSGFEAAKSVVSSGVNFIVDKVNGIINGINNVSSKVGVPRIPNIPRLATGTEFFQGGIAMVGENGPELVSMPRGARVTGANETSAQGGGGNATFYGDIHLGDSGAVKEFFDKIGRNQELAQQGLTTIRY